MANDGAPVLAVAIDGPVGVGKSTVALRLARALGWRHLDTGAMYRAVTFKVLESGRPLDDAAFAAQVAENLELHWDGAGTLLLDGRDVTAVLRDERVSSRVAIVADNLAVRRALVSAQRRIGAAYPCVMEGRDIATVVFPDALFKFYLDAAPEVRVDRRALQLEGIGKSTPREEIFRNLVERDRRDREREWGALRCAEGATLVDSTYLSLDDVVELLASIVRRHPLAAGACA